VAGEMGVVGCTVFIHVIVDMRDVTCSACDYMESIGWLSFLFLMKWMAKLENNYWGC
jgi:hypothetical protein